MPQNKSLHHFPISHEESPLSQYTCFPRTLFLPSKGSPEKNTYIRAWLPSAEVVWPSSKVTWDQSSESQPCHLGAAGSCHRQGCGKQRRVTNGLLERTLTQKRKPLPLTHSCPSKCKRNAQARPAKTIYGSSETYSGPREACCGKE